MPVVALIFSTLLFWVVYWFIRMGGIDHVQERVAQRRDSARRLQTKEASWLAPLRSVNDPRDAAAILMLLIARVHGDPTRDQIATVERFMRTEFGFAHELPERMTRARFLARQAHDFDEGATAFAGLFKRCLTPDECQRLIEILEEVAHEAEPSEHQIEAIASFKPLIGLLPT